MRFVANRFVREAKQADVQQLKERLFGPHRGLPGERWFARPLDGKTLRQWYFPSKYAFQNFRLDEYFEMQHERFAARPVHPAIILAAHTLQRLLEHQPQIEAYLASVSEESLAQNPALRDLKDFHHLFITDAEPDASLSAATAEQLDELTFLLEMLRAHAGAKVAAAVAERINVEGLNLKNARAAVFEAMKMPAGATESPAKMEPKSDEQKKLLSKRYRFIDPLYRRRRVKWMERLLTQKHSAQELKHHSYYQTHPDQMESFPTNMGPATIKWPSPYQ